MIVLPPGNILQNIYLKERIKLNKWKTFIEVGAGNGYVSNILLKKGFSGIGCDLNQSACFNNAELNKSFVNKGNYAVLHQDMLSIETPQKFDLLISSMVIEHLPPKTLNEFILKCKSLLNKNGAMIFYVPASMKYWGIEDEIAGHIKRYEFEDFKQMSNQYNLSIQNIAGLTYPLSNWLLSLSNALIKKKESKVLTMTQKEKTIYTGNRNVTYKTTFPKPFGLVLNESVMYPLHLLQKMFIKTPNCLVIYCEFIKND